VTTLDRIIGRAQTGGVDQRDRDATPRGDARRGESVQPAGVTTTTIGSPAPACSVHTSNARRERDGGIARLYLDRDMITGPRPPARQMSATRNSARIARSGTGTPTIRTRLAGPRARVKRD
jgi:hypothetical protein